MAKTALSITLDNELIKELKFLAKQEKRTVSNLSEVIFSGYIEERLYKKPVEQSLSKAKDFTKSFQVQNYNEVEKALEKNITLSDIDKDFLDF